MSKRTSQNLSAHPASRIRWIHRNIPWARYDVGWNGIFTMMLTEPSKVKRLSTNLPDHFRTSLEDESVSVIHAPEGFGKFVRQLLVILSDATC